MRILLVTSTMPYGPTEAFIIAEAQELRRQGHQVLVVPMYPRGAVVHEDARAFVEPEVAQGVLTPAIARAALAVAWAAPRRAAASFGAMLQARRLRLIAKNMVVYPKGLWLAGVARTWRADHIYVHWAATTASMAMVASAVAGVPWSFTAHRWDVVENNMLDAKLRSARLARFISRRSLQLVGEPSGAPVVLFMGVSLPGAPPAAARIEARHRRRVVLCPANLIALKGHRYLIEAFSRLEGDLCLWLAGDGPLRRTLEAQVRAAGLAERVRFLGQLPHAALLRLYEHDEVMVVCLPSCRDDALGEGIPVALLEAMSHGVPVVSTRTGGIPELIEPGAGLMVPPADAGAIAAALRLLASDPAAYARLALAGRRRIEEHFAIDCVVRELVARFEEVSA